MTTTVTKDDLAAQSTDNGQAVSDTTKYTGEFEGTFTGTLVGNATTAKELEKPYNFTLSGDATGTVAVNASSVILETTVNQATHANTADFAGKTNLAARSTLADMANTAEFAYRAGKLSKLFVNITGACVGSGSATDSDTIDINIDNINVGELFVVGALPEEKANTSRIYVDISNRHFWIYNNDTAKWYDCFEQLETELDNHELRIADLEKLDLSNRVTSLETRATANDVTVADFEKRITANASDIDAVEDRATNLETNVKTNTDNISTLDTRVTATETSITKLDQRVDNIETSTDVGALATKITSIEEKNTEQDASIKANTDAISTEVSNRSAADTALEGKISDEVIARTNADNALAASVKDDIQPKLDALETKNSEQDTSIKANADAIAENKTACDNANTALDTRVTNIENSYVTLDSEQTVVGVKTFSSVIKAASPSMSSDGTDVATTTWVKSKLLDFIYPVGSIYLSVNNVSPASFLGGTWEALQDRFLIGAGDTYAVNATGGSTTHTLTIAELPSHTHKFSGSSIAAHTHTVNNVLNYSTMYNGDVERSEYSLSGNYRVVSSTTSSAGGSSASGSINSVGSDSAHSIMNPYLAVYMWKRTA